MNNIICATRAGEGSRAVQLAAIEHAGTSGARLTFFYVVDPVSLGEVDEGLKAAVLAELVWLGKTLLQVADGRANAAGLNAELIIREGRVREEISRLLLERNPSLLLMGGPRGMTANVFGDDEIERFARSVEEGTGVPVKIVRPEAYDSPGELPSNG